MTHKTDTFWLLASLAVAGCATQVEQPENVTTLSAALASGTVDLIAVGSLSGNISDLSTETAAQLEDGAPGNLLGGIGSGFTYAGGKHYLALPDRGPNAISYDSAIDDTASFIDRFQTLKIKLAASPNGATLPFTATPTLKKTTLLWTKDPLVYGSGAGLGVGSGVPALNDKNTHYFTGRSDNFDPTQPSGFVNDGRLDPESIRVSNDGNDVFISDEYGPFVYQFARGNGKRRATFVIPPEFAITHLSPVGATEISGNTSGRVANKGMEGLAITPSNQMLYGAMQSPLIQDGGTSARFTRILAISLADGTTKQYAYELTNIGSATKPKYPTVSDIVAINEHEFLVDERDGNGLGDNSTASYKRLWHIDLSSAQDVTGISGEANLSGKAVAKTLFADLVAIFNAHGIASTDIPAKLEGISFGPDVVLGGNVTHTLFVSNDNDFIGTVTDSNHPNGIDNPNKFFVLGFDSSVLPGLAQPDVTDTDDGDDSDS